jgi:predicted NAD/FAD-binding protein
MELNGRAIAINSLEVDGVDSTDYPDFCDAYFSYGEYEDGTELTDDELEQLTRACPEMVNEMAYESLV